MAAEPLGAQPLEEAVEMRALGFAARVGVVAALGLAAAGRRGGLALAARRRGGLALARRRRAGGLGRRRHALLDRVRDVARLLDADGDLLLHRHALLD